MEHLVFGMVYEDISFHSLDKSMQVVTNISYGAVPYCGAVLYNTGGGGAGRQLFNIKDDLSAGRNRHCKRGKENMR